MKNKDKRESDGKESGNTQLYFWAILSALLIGVTLAILAMFAERVLLAFAGTAEDWRGLAETIRAVPAWWAFVPSITLLASALGFCGVRWVQAVARVYEMGVPKRLVVSNNYHTTSVSASTVASRHEDKLKQRLQERPA